MLQWYVCRQNVIETLQIEIKSLDPLRANEDRLDCTVSNNKFECQRSPAENLDDLAIASIENVFVYSDRYGHSALKSD